MLFSNKNSKHRIEVITSMNKTLEILAKLRESNKLTAGGIADVERLIDAQADQIMKAQKTEVER